MCLANDIDVDPGPPGVYVNSKSSLSDSVVEIRYFWKSWLLTLKLTLAATQFLRCFFWTFHRSDLEIGLVAKEGIETK